MRELPGRTTIERLLSVSNGWQLPDGKSHRHSLWRSRP